MSQPTILDVFFEMIQLLPKKVQWVIAWLMAAALFTFFVFLGYLYVTGNLW